MEACAYALVSFDRASKQRRTDLVKADVVGEATSPDGVKEAERSESIDIALEWIEGSLAPWIWYCALLPAPSLFCVQSSTRTL